MRYIDPETGLPLEAAHIIKKFIGDTVSQLAQENAALKDKVLVLESENTMLKNKVASLELLVGLIKVDVEALKNKLI